MTSHYKDKCRKLQEQAIVDRKRIEGLEKAARPLLKKLEDADWTGCCRFGYEDISEEIAKVEEALGKEGGQ